jgi:LacI family transcriptional regulator, galactose operon repressor
MNARFLSHKDIASHAGVSRTTVSYALNNSPKISAPVRQRIQAVARRLGYRPDPQVAKLMTYLRTTRSTRTLRKIAFFIPGYPESMLATDRRIQQMVQGVSEGARQHGFGVELIWLTGVPGMTVARIRRILRARGVDGVIVGSMARGDDRLDFDFTAFSCAAIGYSMRTPNIHRAAPHHFRLMRDMLAEVSRREFQRIGVILSRRLEDGSNNLLSAAVYQMQASLPPHRRLPVHVEDFPSLPVVAHFIKKYRPDILIGHGGTYAQLIKLGLKVPEEISFVSIDLGDPPYDAAGFDGRYDVVAMTAVDLVATQFTLNLTGIPAEPKVVMVPSEWRPGWTLGTPAIRNKSFPRPASKAAV